MEIGVNYLTPKAMDYSMGVDYTKTDIHLEADIHVTANNPCGYGEGDWIPYLTIKI